MSDTPRDDDEAEFDLGISLETVATVVDHIRAIQEEEEGEDAIDPEDEEPEEGEEDFDEDTLTAFIEELNEDEQAALVALAWTGRGDYEPEEWEEALRMAKERARNEVDKLSTVLPDKQAQVKVLQNDIYHAQMLESLAKEDLANWQRASRELYDVFVDTNNDIHNIARQITFLREELGHLDEQVSRTRLLAEDYQQRYNAAAAELQILESRQRAIQRNADLLLHKVQEAQIAVRQEMSDVTIAAAAVTPQKHYFPKRTLFLVVLTAVTFVLLCGALGRQRYLELRNS